MVIINRSRIPTRVLEDLIAFTGNCCDHDILEDTVLEIEDTDEIYGFQGLCVDPRPEHGPRNRIQVEIGGECSYPYRFEYRKRAGAVEWQGPDEEFVHVLAHELGHVMQHRKRMGMGNTRYYEVEAERFAHKILDRYRETSRAKAA